MSFIDVEDVKFVINYDYPNNSEDYVHRIGRTGRSKQTGTAYTFFTPHNSRQAPDLIAVLTEANQSVSPKLKELADKVQYRQGGGSFGGPMRNNRWKPQQKPDFPRYGNSSRARSPSPNESYNAPSRQNIKPSRQRSQSRSPEPKRTRFSKPNGTNMSSSMETKTPVATSTSKSIQPPQQSFANSSSIPGAMGSINVSVPPPMVNNFPSQVMGMQSVPNFPSSLFLAPPPPPPPPTSSASSAPGQVQQYDPSQQQQQQQQQYAAAQQMMYPYYPTMAMPGNGYTYMPTYTVQ